MFREPGVQIGRAVLREYGDVVEIIRIFRKLYPCFRDVFVPARKFLRAFGNGLRHGGFFSVFDELRGPVLQICGIVPDVKAVRPQRDPLIVAVDQYIDGEAAGLKLQGLPVQGTVQLLHPVAEVEDLRSPVQLRIPQPDAHLHGSLRLEFLSRHRVQQGNVEGSGQGEIFRRQPEGFGAAGYIFHVLRPSLPELRYGELGVLGDVAVGVITHGDLIAAPVRGVQRHASGRGGSQDPPLRGGEQPPLPAGAQQTERTKQSYDPMSNSFHNRQSC